MEQFGGHILVVDDESENIRLIGNLLTAQGYEVHVAESGEMALEIVREISPEVHLDLILLDILMPVGMDGIQTCRRLKSWRETRNTPVIFLTGKDDEKTMLRAFEAGGADYVLKPFNMQVLLARVQTHSRLGLLSSGLESALAERTRELRDANEKLRQLAIEISLIEEREKKRLAGELHDSPMQKLALAQAQIASAARYRDQESTERLDTGLELMREALQELRSLQFELSPPLLYQEGLVPALEWLASHATLRFGLTVSFVEARPIPVLDRNLAIILFQCARELVYNLAKHAGASEGRIELDIVDNGVQLVVSDNGKGFRRADTPGKETGERGYGLFSIRERLLLVGGDLVIESGAAGTRASVRIPLTIPEDREVMAAESLPTYAPP
jgi:signal transduction histidine kinase